MSALLIVSELGIAKVIAAKNPPPGALKLQDWLMQGWNIVSLAVYGDVTSGAPSVAGKSVFAALQK